MWDRISLITLILALSILSNAQKNGHYAPNGGVFTPKGTLKVLVVFAHFKDGNTASPNFSNRDAVLDGWSYDISHREPDVVSLDKTEATSYIYSSKKDFRRKSQEDNFSTIFHDMSLGQFLLIGDYFRNTRQEIISVEVDPSGVRNWMEMNRKTLAAMKRENPHFDFSSFDQRKNNPQFKFDNTDTVNYPADKIIDYTIFIYRYNPTWKIQPHPNMPYWMGSGGGFASTGLSHQDRFNGYSFTSGFTMRYRSGVFIHEIAHTLFNAPHTMGVNGVIGDYFNLSSAGWGIMAPIPLFQCFNAWERWYVGFIDLVADIQSKEDLKTTHRFILRDYITTGDALRIAIPYSNGQRLWLEYHAKKSVKDAHPWNGQVIGKDTLADSDAGIYAYVENIASKRTDHFSALSNRANGLRILHAGGHYDYELVKTPMIRNAWGNPLYTFRRGRENSIAGISNLDRFKADINKDGEIHLDPNYNAARGEAFPMIIREEVEPGKIKNLYGAFGVYDIEKNKDYAQSPAFKNKMSLGLNSNPMLINYPFFDRKKKRLAPYYLNGLEINFRFIKALQAYEVEVNYEKVNIKRNLRWCGSIILPNITEDKRSDLVVGKGKKIYLSKSGTANRVRPDSHGEFIDRTILVIRNGSCLELKRKSKIIIEKGATLFIEKGALLKMARCSRILIQKGGILKYSAGTIDKKIESQIKIKGQMLEMGT